MLKIIELFAGIGACSSALDRLGIEHEIVDAVEIDKYAIASFNAIHNTNFTTQDIVTWNKDIEVDLIMHGSPCQDFSLAGKQAGGDIGSGTRSSLMYETIRIVGKLRPKYVIWENVKNVLSAKHKHNFDNYLTAMQSLGYTNYYEVLNAKDFGVPQNRERVFTVSILNGNFEFPQKQELKLRLKDILEDKVDEKYYLSEKMTNYVLDNNETQKGTKWEGRADNDTLNSNIAHTLSVRGACGCQRAGVSNFIVEDYEDEIKVKDLKLKIKNATKKGYIEAEDGDSANLAYPESNTRRGRVGKQVSQTLQCTDNMGVVVSAAMRGRYDNDGKIVQKIEISEREYANAITTVQKDSMILNGVKIRKLTPKECWRLMGFTDEEFEKAEKINSNTQLYKQAGNSIVVNALVEIFKNLFIRSV